MTTSSVPPVTTKLVDSETGIMFIIHAGASSRGKHSTSERITQVELDLQCVLGAGYQLLESGAPAHEAVVVATHVMEDVPEFNAGRGTALTNDGITQMDTCLVTGDGEVGAVTGASTVRNPTDAARAVKEQTKYVLFADPANAEITDWGVATESDEYFITGQRRQSLAEARSGGDEWGKHGAIGAAARDAEGNIAAGMSTGDITNQTHGRVGDSLLSGCDTFANQSTVAVSYTGIGKAFIKVVVAHQVLDRVRSSDENAEDAVTATLDEVAAHHSDGGMVVLPVVGRDMVVYNSKVMNLGYHSAQGGKVQG